MTASNPIPWPEDEPTVALYPTAARALGVGRSATYETARQGTFPVRIIRCGKQLRVPTSELRRVLGLDTSKPITAESAGTAA